ncbi:hypothetical protein DM01DRAFT_1403452 [Hesseltinella vesiculosa]|uniref:PIN domain-containing protein n=1 Tax=Hesseltinella vesiculosa TaxID=101127 RepID=A0A1X2GYA5_9FUNG|nr:hypothetical protein DM01DRAFT_1403452 [Hesseltinella vesiculosa]
MNQSSRKGGRSSSARNDFHRGTQNTEQRALFNPNADHPITFNKDAPRPTMPQRSQQSVAPMMQHQRKHPDQGRGRPAASGRTLWEPSQSVAAPARPPVSSTIRSSPPDPHSAPSSPPTTARSPKKSSTDQAADQHRQLLKSKWQQIQQLEAQVARHWKLAQSTTYGQGLVYQPKEQDEISRHDAAMTSATDRPPLAHPWLTMQPSDWQAADAFWQEKMDLHFKLARAFLEMVCLDYDVALNKNLEGLCWKHAVYAVVVQLRQALQQCHVLALAFPEVKEDADLSKSRTVSADDMDVGRRDADADADELKLIKSDEKDRDDGVTVYLFNAGDLQDEVDKDDGSDPDEEAIMVPVVTEHGMTMIPMANKKKEHPGTLRASEKAWSHRQVYDQHCQWMATFLERAVVFYQGWMAALFRLDGLDLKTMDSRLQLWQRRQRWKWFNAVFYRCDLARYQFLHADRNAPGHTKAAAWHLFGAWLMPSSGRLYAQLALLCSKQQTATKTDPALHLPLPTKHMHQVYFATRALMVRRNAVASAREHMLELLEQNRQWHDRHLSPSASAGSRKKAKKASQALQRPVGCSDSDWAVGLFLRLHGLLFTKIGLDAFGQVKTEFLAHLFHDSKGEPRLERGQQDAAQTPAFGGQAWFWMEALVLTVSAVYQYNYSTSTVSKSLQAPWSDANDELIRDTVDNIMVQYALDLLMDMVLTVLTRRPGLETSPCLAPLAAGDQAVGFSLLREASLVFGSSLEPNRTDIGDTEHSEQHSPPWQDDSDTSLIFLGLFLQWMVMTGIGIRRRQGCASAWEQWTGHRPPRAMARWWHAWMPLLNELLHSLEPDERHALVQHHILSASWTDSDDWTEDHWQLVLDTLGPQPLLPEDDYVRGCGWVDDFFLKRSPASVPMDNPMAALPHQRLVRLLHYAFLLVKQMNYGLEYDPVLEAFHVKDVPLDDSRAKEELQGDAWASDELEDDGSMSVEATQALQQMELMALSDDEQDGDVFGALRERRQQLQDRLATIASPQRPTAQEHLQQLREKIVPGKTVLVLDTNCFIGHLDLIRRVFEQGQWQIIIPLAVITELDGLQGNAPPLGQIAQDALTLIETTLQNKTRRRDLLRIQTSHHHFLYDIAIRSEQFDFGETGKNLDDLVLSTCLWWLKQASAVPVFVPVCLVTADRNLKVKARAREVHILPVRALL